MATISATTAKTTVTVTNAELFEALRTICVGAGAKWIDGGAGENDNVRFQPSSVDIGAGEVVTHAVVITDNE